MNKLSFRKNIDFDKPETNYYKVGLNHFTYDEGIFYNQNSPSDRWKRIQKEQDIEIKPWQHMTMISQIYFIVITKSYRYKFKSIIRKRMKV